MALRASPLKVLQQPRFGWLPDIRFVQVMTHSRCNADCLFCPYSESQHVKEPGKMTDETWHLLLANLRPWTDGINRGKVCPYLMQEPLIDKTIFAKIADVYRCFPRTTVEVSTNGAALTEANAAKLFELFRGRHHELWVSHHGVDKATLEGIMVIDYDRTTSNLLAAIRASRGEVHIKIRGAGESRDGKHVYFTREQYRDYWKRLFAKHQVDPRWPIEVDAFTFHDRAGTLHRTDRGADTLDMGTQRVIDAEHPFHCPRVDQWLHFGWDGSIRLCCMDYHHEVELPNVNRMSLLDYFHGAEYYELVEKISGRAGPCDPKFICSRCTSPGG